MHRPRRLPIGLLTLAALGSICRTAEAQETRKIAARPTCPDCRIEWTHITTLGGLEDRDGLIHERATLAIDRQGHFFVSPTYNPGEILVYDRTGMLLRRFGREGSGPGEYRSIHRIIFGGDSLFVIDPRGTRATVANDHGEVYRTVHIPSVPPNVVLPRPDGGLFLQIDLNVTRSTRMPFHRVDASGTITSFGSDPPYPSRPSVLGWRAMALGPNGTVWQAYYNKYRLEQWDSTNTLLNALEMDADWFAPWDGAGPDNPNPPTIRTIRTDEHGRIWVVTQIPPTLTDNGQGLDRVFIQDYHPLVDIRVDVIDVQAGRLVATGNHPLVMARWVGDKLYSIREGPDGEPLMDIWHVQLHEPPSNR